MIDRLGGRAVGMAVVLLVLLCVVPLVTDDFVLSVLTLIFLFASVGQAWNLMMGYAGQLSLGHALYFGTGAYAMALLINKFDLSAWFGLPVSFAVGAGLGALGAFGAAATAAMVSSARLRTVPAAASAWRRTSGPPYFTAICPMVLY